MKELIKRLEHELLVSIHAECTGVIFELKNEEIEKIIEALKLFKESNHERD